MKKFLSILRDVGFVIFVIAICGMIFIMSTGKHVSIAGYQVLRVLTSSMEPAIAENTCIIIKEYPVEQLKVGDIITFTSDDPQIQGYYNTHRIHEIIEENGETLYITKGDAGDAIDAYPVHQYQVAGIFVRELPGGRTIGKCFVALSDNKIYFLVVMLPLTLCLLSYFWQIVGMVTGRFDDEDEDEDEEDGEEPSNGGKASDGRNVSGIGKVSVDGNMSGGGIALGGALGGEEIADGKSYSDFVEINDSQNKDFGVVQDSDEVQEFDVVRDSSGFRDSSLDKTEAAYTKGTSVPETEEERIRRIVEELTTESVSDEVVEEMQAKLKAECEKRNKKQKPVEAE